MTTYVPQFQHSHSLKTRRALRRCAGLWTEKRRGLSTLILLLMFVVPALAQMDAPAPNLGASFLRLDHDSICSATGVGKEQPRKKKVSRSTSSTSPICRLIRAADCSKHRDRVGG